MKFIQLLSAAIVVFLVSCGSPIREESSEVAEKPVEVEETPVDSALEAKVRAMLGIGYPKLSDENAEEFLAEWLPEHSERNIVVHTKLGDIFIELYDETPIHTSNFLYKIHRQYYNPSEFTRVVPDFVIQGGNSEEEKPQQQRFLIGNHSLPSEFIPGLYHHRGAVAMSRGYSNNPDKRSSSYDFYIVTGRRISDVELAAIEREKGISYTDAQKKLFKNVGGAPHLDFEHTVFGRVTEGMDVVDLIAATPADESEWPLEKLELSIELVQD